MKIKLKRAFICGDLTFPRGGASSNYVQYLGMALSECGYETHVISTTNKSYKKLILNKIYIDPYIYSQNKIVRYIEYWAGAGQKIIAILKKYNINSDDIIIMYSQKAILGWTLRRFARRRQIKIGASVVELFEKKDMTCSNFSWNYFQYKILIEKEYPKFDFLFPISTYIKAKYENYGIKQLILPILADPYEYTYKEKNFAVKKFIFPALGKMKDSLENMIWAIDGVLREKKDNIEIHFCGIKSEQVAHILKVDEKEIDPRIIFHDWMEYDELVELYRQVHFLLLARPDTQMTRANFPSKVPETMTYGIIPLASRVGDYTKLYLKNDYNSFTFKGCNVKTIKNIIYKCINLSEDETRKLSDNARKTVEEKFYYKQWSETIKNFLQAL